MTLESSTDENPNDAAFPPPLVAETLQYRLETGNIAKHGGQRGSLTRCAQKFGVFQSNLLTAKPDAEAIESSKQDLMQNVETFKLEMYKLLLSQRNLDTQVTENEKAIQERDSEIERRTKEVAASQAEASHALEKKNCFMEYEALAKLTNESNPQSSKILKSKLLKVQKEIEDFEKEARVTDHLTKVREGQFQLLIQYMMDLKRSLDDPEEQEKLLELVKNNSQKASGDGEDKTAEKPSDSKPDSMDVDEEEDGLYGDLV